MSVIILFKITNNSHKIVSIKENWKNAENIRARNIFSPGNVNIESDQITSITIPESVISIGESAFEK